MQHCHIAQWHDGYSISGRQRCRLGQPAYRTTPRGERHNSTLCFTVRCWLSMDCAWVSSRSRSVTKLCSLLLDQYQRWWMNRHYRWNLGSLIQTKSEMPIKWMEASRFFSSKGSTAYTVCCEDDDHCGVWGNAAPCGTSKADDICCLLLHISSRALWRKWWTDEGPFAPLPIGDSGTSPYSPDMSPCDYSLFAKVKEPLRGTQ